jgi:hypothetical protein
MHYEHSIRYDNDMRWKISLDDMLSALGVHLGDVMFNSDHMRHPYFTPEYDYEPPRKDWKERMKAFNLEYLKYYEQVDVPKARRPGGRKPRVRTAPLEVLQEGVNLIEQAGGLDLTSKELVTESKAGTDTSKPKRPTNKERFGPKPAKIDATRYSAREIAAYCMAPKLPKSTDRVLWDEDVFSRGNAGKLRSHHIEAVLEAKNSQGIRILSEERAGKVIHNYEGWCKSHEIPRYYARSGEVRKRAQPELIDTREKHSGRYVEVPATEKIFSAVGLNEAMDVALRRDVTFHLPGAKKPITRVRGARERIDEAARETVDLDRKRLKAEDDARKRVVAAEGEVRQLRAEVTSLENKSAITARRTQEREAYLCTQYPGFAWPDHLAEYSDGGRSNKKRKLPGNAETSSPSTDFDEKSSI